MNSVVNDTSRPQHIANTYSVMAECLKKKYWFLFALIVSILISAAISYWQPSLYVAKLELSDEHKESMDLVVGLSTISVTLRDLQASDEGIVNNADTYTSITQSDSFLKKLLGVYLSKEKSTYHDYLLKKRIEPWWNAWKQRDEVYAMETLRESFSCHLNKKYYTIDIKFLDQNPDVATLMCESVRDTLACEVQRIYYEQKNTLAKSLEEYESRTCNDYKQALKKYVRFCETHYDMETQAETTEAKALKGECDAKLELWNKVKVLHFRFASLKERTVNTFAELKSVTVSKTKYSPTPFTTFCAVFTILFVLVFFAVCWQRRRHIVQRVDMGSVTSPWTITFLVWAAIMFFMQFRDPSLLVPLKGQIYIALAIWLPLFTITGVVVYNLLPAERNAANNHQSVSYAANNNRQSVSNAEFSKLAYIILFTFAVTCTPLVVYKVYQVVSMFDSTDMLNNVRILAVGGETQMGFLNYTHVINQVLLVVAFWHYPKIPLWQVLTLCLLNILSAMAIMEKGTLFFLAVSLFFVLFEKKVISIRGIFIAAVCVLGIMYLFNIIRSSEAELEADQTTAFDFFAALYVLSPCQAFETIIPDLTEQTGMHTFDTIYLFMQRFGIVGIEVPEKIQEFVWVSIPTNVYTIFQPFYFDFGYVGIAVFAVVYGFFTGIVYRGYRNGSNVARCIYTYLMYALVLQFYQEYIFLSIVPFLQFIFFSTLICQNKVVLKWTSR